MGSLFLLSRSGWGTHFLLVRALDERAALLFVAEAGFDPERWTAKLLPEGPGILWELEDSPDSRP